MRFFDRDFKLGGADLGDLEQLGERDGVRLDHDGVQARNQLARIQRVHQGSRLNLPDQPLGAVHQDIQVFARHAAQHKPVSQSGGLDLHLEPRVHALPAYDQIPGKKRKQKSQRPVMPVRVHERPTHLVRKRAKTPNRLAVP